ncbi:MAG TPA: hypothetical protein VL651_12075 [Bacteroidia bacterium]|jgi:hypothetical protein|nr:hypothetical protein [Bacteroidia bacterium]
MKKLFLFIGLVIFGFTIANSSVARKTLINKHPAVLAQDTAAGWQKAATWTAMSDNKKLIYKINPKSLTVYASWNSKTWSAVIGGTWVDKNGNWIKIQNKKLVSSSDKGATWTEISDGKWQDADGDWCMFGSDWSLWIKK